MTAVEAIVSRAMVAGFMPPPNLTVSEFADRELVVATGPLAGARWRTSFAPYQRGLLDAFHETGVEIVVLMCSSQVGKTSMAVNLVAYHIAWDPCPILVVMPTVDPMARDFSKNRLQPVIDATPILDDTVSKRREKDSSNTVLLKTFRGGYVAIGGANSAASLAARSTRLLIMDEIDRFPAELPGEGSTIAVAHKRTTAFGYRRRIFMDSSPTISGAPIDTWFKRGDQRRYHVPCPGCGIMHPYEWKNVKWENRDPKTARLECPECEYRIYDAERVAVLDDGEWIADNPDRIDETIVSYHLWEAYSPVSSLPKMVAAFLAAREKQKAGDDAEMHTFQNTTLGEPIQYELDIGPKADDLTARRESYPAGVDVPAGACVLTAGIDTQDDRLEVIVVGWGPGEQSWIVDQQIIPGDTSEPEPWANLDEVLSHEYMHETGVRLPIRASCLDTAGHRTTQAYDYVARNAARRVYATIGRDGQDRPIVSAPARKRWGKNTRKVQLFTVGIDSVKRTFMTRLKVPEPGPGYVHIPLADWADEEFIAQLTSERLKLIYHRGVSSYRWVKTRQRNEMLDCVVLSTAALQLARVDLQFLLDQLTDPPENQPAPEANPKKPFLTRRKGFLKR